MFPAGSPAAVIDYNQLLPNPISPHPSQPEIAFVPVALREQTALVTGAAVRLGRAIALRLAQEGVHIAAHYHGSGDDARTLLQELRACGVRAELYQTDLAQPLDAAASLLPRIRRELGPVQLLVNSAAIFEPGTLDDTSLDHWERHLNLNLAAPFFLTQQFVKQLPQDQAGAVVNIIDWRAERPIPGHAAYTIAKAGLWAQTQLLAQELAPRVRVNAVAPGAILPAPGQSAADFERQCGHVPLQRSGDPSDIADAVVHLLSAKFVTGEMLHVTGGEHLTVRRPQDGAK